MVPLGDRSMISQKSCNWLAIDLRKRDSLFVFFSAKMSNLTSILLLLLFFPNVFVILVSPFIMKMQMNVICFKRVLGSRRIFYTDPVQKKLDLISCSTVGTTNINFL